MMPILYAENEKAFTTQGLGRLSGATECTVTEERNGSYELEMEYPVDGIHWKDIKHSRIICAQPADGKEPQPFRIYKIGKPLNGRCAVQARHISYQTSHIPVMPFTAYSFQAALSGLVQNAAEDCPFTVWTDKNTTGSFKIAVPTSFRSALGGTEGSLLDVFGTAEYEFDKWLVKAHVSRGVDRGVVLRYGKNITSLKQEENIQNTITGICPYWVDRKTEMCKTLPEKVLWSDRAGNFPYKRTIPVDLSSQFEEEPTDDELRDAGNDYIAANNIGVPSVSIDLSFIPLWQTEEYKGIANLERINLCDTVTVVFDKLGVSTTAKVVKTVFDVLRERYRSIEIGDAKTTLAKATIKQKELTNQKIKDSRSMLAAYINYVTEKIMGGKGGYVVFGYNADGLPEEMLILDTPDESTANSIIRLNKNGIAFSRDGGATYKTGWTIDGVFCADFIGTGVLDANLVRAGVLQDVAGTNYWDMETGEFRLSANTSVGGQTVDEIAAAAKEAAVAESNAALSSYAQTVNSGMNGLQAQIDGQIQTWFYSYLPTKSNIPASGWTTVAEKNKHLGDLFYVVDNTQYGGQVYRWALINETYGWAIVEDTELAKALSLASTAQDTADNKRRIFVDTPTPPYDVGDLWTQGSSGDIMVCKTARETGNYVVSDWQLASNYIDLDTAETTAESAAAKAVVATDVEYGNSSSLTVTPTTWTTDAAWKQGQFLWTRVKMTLKNGDISYSSARMIANGNGIGVSKVTEQYYLSTSNTACAGGSWSDSQQTWKEGRYYWTRSKIEWADGSTTYTDPVLAAALTSGNQSTNDLDKALTQAEVFNRLTNNGKIQGIYMSDGQLYINASYIASGQILADILRLYGRMIVYTDKTLATNGGYVGYMSGMTGEGIATDGITLMSSNEKNFLLATSAGIRMNHINDSKKTVLALSGGNMTLTSELLKGGFASVWSGIQGDVFLNTNMTQDNGAISHEYSGYTHLNDLHIHGNMWLNEGKYFRLTSDDGTAGLTANYNWFKKINDAKMTLLWSNASPGSSFSEQYINVNISPYNLFFFEVEYSANYTEVRSGAFVYVPSDLVYGADSENWIKLQPSVTWFSGNNNYIAAAYRQFWIRKNDGNGDAISNGQIWASTGHRVGGTDAVSDTSSYCIPTRIFGMKV